MSGPKVTADRPRRSWVPAGTIAFPTALYAPYFYWEQSDWGSAGRPRPGRQRGVHADQPGRADAVRPRLEAGDPGSGRAPRPPPARARRGDGVHRQRHLDRVRPRAATTARRSPGPTRSTSSDSLLTLTALLSFPLARRTRLERWKFLLDARDGAGGRRGRDLVLLGPADGRVAGEQRRRRRCWRSPIRWRACWCCSASPRCCSAGRSTATGWRSACW